MKKIIAICLLLTGFTFSQNAWINEFHYDNAGSDVNEFVEIAVENISAINKSDFKIYLIKGDGTIDESRTLNSGNLVSTTNEISLFLFSTFSLGNTNAGIAIEYEENLIQFISYEGSFEGSEGIVLGETSENISVSQDNSTPVGSSLGLEGDGTTYSDFHWQIFATATPGQPNTTQALPVELTTFSASVLEQSVELNWETATEVNNYGFDVERKFEEGDWSKLEFVLGNGNSNSPKYYSFVDNSIETSGKYFYRLKQVDIDGAYEYSDVVEANLGTPSKFELNQNYPNPFNPTTSIQFNLPHESEVKLSVFNVLGEEVEELLNVKISAGYHSFNFNAGKLNSGIYFYKLESNHFMQIRKMMFIK